MKARSSNRKRVQPSQYDEFEAGYSVKKSRSESTRGDRGKSYSGGKSPAIEHADQVSDAENQAPARTQVSHAGEHEQLPGSPPVERSPGPSVQLQSHRLSNSLQRAGVPPLPRSPSKQNKNRSSTTEKISLAYVKRIEDSLTSVTKALHEAQSKLNKEGRTKLQASAVTSSYEEDTRNTEDQGVPMETKSHQKFHLIEKEIESAGKYFAYVYSPWLTLPEQKYIFRRASGDSGSEESEIEEEMSFPATAYDKKWGKYHAKQKKEALIAVLNLPSLSLLYKCRSKFIHGMQLGRSEAVARIKESLPLIYKTTDASDPTSAFAIDLLRGSNFLYSTREGNTRSGMLEATPLIEALSCLLYGRSSIRKGDRAQRMNACNRRVKGAQWQIIEITPAMIAFTAILVRFALATDATFEYETSRSLYLRLQQWFVEHGKSRKRVVRLWNHYLGGEADEDREQGPHAGTAIDYDNDFADADGSSSESGDDLSDEAESGDQASHHEDLLEE